MSQLYSKKTVEKIRQRILVPVALSFLLLMAGAAMSIHWLTNHHIEEVVEQATSSVSALFEHSLLRDTRSMEGLLHFIQDDPRLRNAWIAKDRDQLYKYALPVFNRIRQEHRVTHFYFHSPDKTCFLRVHNPIRFGNKISRHTMNNAAGTGECTSGIELGQLGTFTLRVVHPWIIDDELVGYIELGEEVEHITDQVKVETHAELVVTIDKSFLDQTKWEEGLAMMGRTGDWSQFGSFVVIDRTIDYVPAEIDNYPPEGSLVVEIGGEKHLGELLPLVDAGGRTVGNIHVLIEIEHEVIATQKMLAGLGAAGLLLGGGLLLFFYLFVGRIERHLRASRQSLKDEITQRKEAQIAIEDSWRSYRNFAENLPGLVYRILCREGNRMIFFNEMITTLTGYENDDLETGNICSIEPFILEEDRANVVAEVRAAVSEKRPFTVEYRFRRKDGKIAYFSERGRPIFDESGKLSNIDGVIFDITDRKLVEEALKQSQQRLSAHAQQTPLAYIEWNAKLEVLDWNPAAEEMFGYSKEEAMNCHAYEIIVAEEVRPHVGAIFKSLMTRSGGTRSTNDNVTKDGRTITCEWYNTPLIDTDGEVIGLASLVQDVTERKQIEQERLRAAKLESVGILAGGIAHDFNNLLAGILGNIALARNSDEIDEVKSDLEQAEKAAERAQGLTQQLLTFSRGGEPIRKTIIMEDVIGDAARFAVRGSSVCTMFSFQTGLHATRSDAGQISQVIHNLVLNAVQAMPLGGSIRVAAGNVTVGQQGVDELKAGDYVKITVADTGVGIPGDELVRIFDPYFTTKQKGTGLGLAASYSIIKKHGGRITCESEVGRGTTFTILLPASSETPVSTAVGEEVAIKGVGRVLIMDDEEVVRDVAAKSLRRLGFEVEVTCDGGEAVARYREAVESGNPFDVVMLDLTVPGGMGGKETVQELLKINPEVKTIVCSGYSNDRAVANYAEFGFSGVVAKPFRPKELGQAIQNLITASPTRSVEA